MRFFSTLLASILGTLIGVGVLVFFVIIIFASLVAATDAEPTVRKGSVLKMELSGTLPEHQDESLAAFAGFRTPTSVRDVTEALEKAAADDRISAVWLVPDGFSTSWAAAQEVRRALKAFRASGKPLYASSGTGGFAEGEYFLASAADSIFGVPEGGFELNGFAVSVAFYAEMLDKLDVEPLVVRAGGYKSAVEPFTRRELSPENTAQLQLIASRIDSLYVEAVAEGRALPAERLRQLRAASMLQSTREAAEEGLIDVLAYEDELEDVIKKRLAIDTDKPLPIVGLGAYSHTSRSRSGLPDGSDGAIAIVYAVGEILGGAGNSNPLSGEMVVSEESFVATLERVRKDDNIKAVVLRVDSPGGSAAASDVIWRAVSRLSEEKPLVASFGGVAASGGYYIAAPARRIFSEPLSITGSIGVFGLMLNVGPGMEKNLGITFDAVKTDPHADMFSGVRTWTPAERLMMERRVDQTYETFLNRVSAGRDMTTSDVRSVAEGRVWTGLDGVRAGLVDELGGLTDAIAFAANEAGLAEGSYRVRVFPRPQTVLEKLEASFVLVKAGIAESLLRPVERSSPFVSAALRMSDLMLRPWSVETRLPFDITVR